MRKKPCAILFLAACSQAAFAGAPLVTDDADVIEAGSCQFETWVSSVRGGHDYWAVPACNAFANVELSLGVGGVNPPDLPSSQQFVLQAKTVFAGEEDVWSFGAVAGIAHDNGPTADGASSRAYYAKALFTWFPRESLELDLNLGASNDFGAGTILAAGAALQYEFASNTVAFGEVFRDEKGPGKYQLGLRYAIVPERFEVYASYGNKLGSTTGDSWWAVAGIRINTAPFLH